MQDHSTKDGPYLMQKVFMLGSEYRHDMNVMHEQVDAVTAENVFFFKNIIRMILYEYIFTLNKS